MTDSHTLRSLPALPLVGDISGPLPNKRKGLGGCLWGALFEPNRQNIFLFPAVTLIFLLQRSRAALSAPRSLTPATSGAITSFVSPSHLPFLAPFPFFPLWLPQTAVGAAFIGGVLSCVTAGNVRAVLLNCNAPETRGSAFAIYSLMARTRGPPLSLFPILSKPVARFVPYPLARPLAPRNERVLCCSCPRPSALSRFPTSAPDASFLPPEG